MNIDDVVIAAFLTVAGTIAVGGYVIYYWLHDMKMKRQEKSKAH